MEKECTKCVAWVVDLVFGRACVIIAQFSIPVTTNGDRLVAWGCITIKLGTASDEMRCIPRAFFQHLFCLWRKVLRLAAVLCT